MSSSSYPLLERACRGAFPAFSLRRLARTGSTQDRVRELLTAGAEPGTCVVTGLQTAGRGRQGRAWTTPPDTALLMSILLEAGPHAGAIPLAAGLAVGDAAAALGVDVRLKWPNDVLADGRKLAGILAEFESGPPARVILGVGINLTVPEFPDGVPGVSLHALCGRPVAWTEMLEKVVVALRARTDSLATGGVAALRDDWMARAAGIGEAVVAKTAAGDVRGTATGIDDDGALVIATDGGAVRVLAGDVHIGT